MAIPRNKALAARALTLLSVAVLVLAGCGSSGGGGNAFRGGPGVDLTNKTIDLGVLTPLSGPVAAPIGIPLTHGVQAYFDDINANGGIDGFKINLVQKDTQYNPTLQVQTYQEIHNSVAMIAESLGSPTTKAIVDQVNADHLLTSAATLDSYLARQPYLVLVGTPYRLQVENAFDYVVNKLGVASPKTAIIYQNDDYGLDGLAGYKESITAYHLNDGGQVPFTLSQPDFTAQAAQLKASGAKFVFVTATPTDAANIMGTAAKIGYIPQWIFQSPAWHPVLLSTPLAPILEHATWVVGQGSYWGDPSVPGTAQLLKDMQTYFPQEAPTGFFAFGYVESIVTAAILKKAADNHDLSRAGIYNAFNTVGTVSLMGLYPDAHYGSSPNQRVPTRDSTIFQPDPTVPGGLKVVGNDFTGSAAQASQF
jgi:ABC-type branched-subunit amino acid transport system substrate-binding protein